MYRGHRERGRRGKLGQEQRDRARDDGDGHVLAHADAGGGVTESSESNNVTGVTLTVVQNSAAGELILDNAPAGIRDMAGGRTFSGRWCTSSAPSPFGAAHLEQRDL